MPRSYDVHPPRNDADLDRFLEISGDAFVVSAEHAQAYANAIGHDQFRLVRRGNDIVGGLALIRMGQFFGARAVSMAGVAAVAAAAPYRAQGIASTALRRTLAELREEGLPLSTLYPATVALYRSVGYELAGAGLEIRLPLSRLDVRERSLEARPATADDEPAIRNLYRTIAEQTPGHLDRGAFCWRRVHNYRGDPTQGFVVTDGGTLVGYMFLLTQPQPTGYANVRVVDLAAATPAAHRQLLTLLADYRSNRDSILLRGSLNDPLLIHLAEEVYEADMRNLWMLRIVHVANALQARGYPPGLQAELHLQVTDDVLPANNGTYVLRVKDGQATVEGGGRGTLKADIRGLAAMYSGFLSAHDVVSLGVAEGPADQLAAANAVFNGPLPWMRDSF